MTRLGVAWWGVQRAEGRASASRYIARRRSAVKVYGGCQYFFISPVHKAFLLCLEGIPHFVVIRFPMQVHSLFVSVNFVQVEPCCVSISKKIKAQAACFCACCLSVKLHDAI